MAIKLNARSPYYLKATGVVNGSFTVELYIYTGVFTTDKPATPQYTLSKEPLENESYSVFEIGELVRDYLELDFNQEYTEDLYRERIAADGGTFEGSTCLSSVLESLDDDYRSGTIWVEADVVSYDSVGSIVNSEYYDFIGFDGYSYFTDGANSELSRTLLQSNTDIYVLNGNRVQVPVFTEEVTSVQFYNGGVLQSTQTISSSVNSNAQIKYAGTTSATDEIRVISSEGTEIINVYPTDECKYTPYKVTFVNKLGALQNIWFFKKSMESLNTESKQYKANVFDRSILSYDVQTHQYRQFHKKGKERITMNTGYISEDYNEVIKQMMLSEQVWITKTIGSETTVIPTIPKTESLTYKTRVNDKLINYTVDFENAFDEINNIR